MSIKNSRTTQIARALGFRSGFESEMAVELKDLGVAYEYESLNGKFVYKTPVRGGICNACTGDNVSQRRSYTCDFVLYHSRINSPRPVMWIETKGRFTAQDRTKMEAVIKQNPWADIRLLFQYDGKDKGMKRSYMEWCDWKGIKAAVIPQKQTKTKQGIYLPYEWRKELGVS